MSKKQRLVNAIKYFLSGDKCLDSKGKENHQTTMDLKRFVTNALTDIVQSVVEAQENVKRYNAQINPAGLKYNASNLTNQGYSIDGKISQNIEFDLAITVETGSAASGNIKVASGIFNVGTEGEITSQSNTINRIKFNVPILLPFHKGTTKSE
ncbi:MAG: hypothetical protein KAW87_01315 [Candidatus Cloacimonetes bacterium]|nr:hypothetical protein [Candidatus Cloacimonadota bacterium]